MLSSGIGDEGWLSRGYRVARLMLSSGINDEGWLSPRGPAPDDQTKDSVVASI